MTATRELQPSRAHPIKVDALADPILWSFAPRKDGVLTATFGNSPTYRIDGMLAARIKQTLREIQRDIQSQSKE